MLMRNDQDPDRPSAWFNQSCSYRDDKTVYLYIATRMRLYTMPAGFIGQLAIFICKVFHRRKWKTYSMPTAGRKLWFPVACRKCGCQYEISRPHGWRSPWQKDRRKQVELAAR